MRHITILIISLLAFIQEVTAASSRVADRDYWWLCPIARDLPLRPRYSNVNIEPNSSEVRADSTRIVSRRTTLFVGNVEFVHGDQSAVADEVLYDREASTANLQGNASLWGPGLTWQGEKAFFNLETKYGKLDAGRYWLADSPGRGYAEEIRENQAEKVARLFGVDYTTCPEGAERWKFSATKIKLDRNTDRGYATNALLKVGNLPVFYFPYVSFPLSDTRKSGFLIPTFGTSARAGTDIRLPYYLNLAPNYDLVLEPRIVSEHGVMMGADARYMFSQGRSAFHFEFLPNDNLDQGNNRYVVRFTHQQYYDQGRGNLYALFQTASDKRYFEDFGNSLAVTSQVFLDRRIQTTYLNQSLYLTGLMQDYQSIDSAIPSNANPYSRLPQVYAQTMFPMASLRPYFFATSEVTYFDRANSVTGGRVEVVPSISLPWVVPYALVKPTLSIRQTNYMLTNSGVFSDRISRTVPYFTMDAQAFLERRLDLFGEKLLQTFEPRAYYLLVPRVQQHDIPVFDSGLYDFSFLALFLDNRFAGRDRVGDANQLAMGLTSRFVNMDSGREVLRANLGQIYYFRDRTVAMPGARGLSESTSDLIGELSSNLTEDVSARVTALWDPNDSEINKAALTLRYRPTARAVINASYRLNKTVADVDQTDLSFRLPITDNLAAVGRWNYSLKTDQTLEYVGGVELESCCWGIRLITRRYIFNSQGQFDTAVFMQAEFKGLAGYGRGAVSFLRKSVPGYETYF